MSLFIEFHLIQNFAPSNLNRDDTGAPKDAIFGGQRRARVSSQCFKRAMRLKSAELGAIPSEFGSVRTKKLKELLAERLVEFGHTEAGVQIEAALSAAGLKIKDDDKTEYLLFLGQGEIERLAELIHTHWDALGATPAGETKKTKKEAKASAPPEVVKEAKALLDGQKAVDVAMLAGCWRIYLVSTSSQPARLPMPSALIGSSGSLIILRRWMTRVALLR